jgi:uncharacterized membrane protein YkvA (DUF1232 family)
MSLQERANQLKINIPAVFIVMRKKETPLIAKILAGITVVYALSPIDFIPDFIPILGYLDDVILLPCLIAATIKLIPKDVFAECQKQSAGLWINGKPKKWIFAIPVVAIWLLVVFALFSALFGA